MGYKSATTTLQRSRSIDAAERKGLRVPPRPQRASTEPRHRFRRFGAVAELFEEVTALVAAGVDDREVEPKLARALEIADDVAVDSE